MKYDCSSICFVCFDSQVCGAALATAGGTRTFGLERLINQPAQINYGNPRYKHQKQLLKHDVKLRINSFRVFFNFFRSKQVL